jgi:hypothetical protein
MEPEDSLPHSQELCICPYPEPDQSSPHHPIHLSKSILMLSTHLCLGLPSVLFPCDFPTNNLYTFLFSPIHATYLARLILLDFILLIILGEEYKSRPCFAVLSTLPSLHLSSVEIFSTVPCLQTPSVYVPLWISETKFQTHTEQQAKLRSCIFWFLCFWTADKKRESSGQNDSKHFQNSVSS